MKIKWKRLWARSYAPMIASSFIRVFEKRPGYDMCRNKLFIPEGNLSAIYFKEDEFFSLVKTFSRFLFKNNINKYAQRYEQVFKDFLSWSKKAGQNDFNNFSKKKLINFLIDLDKKMVVFGEWQFLAFVVLEGPAADLEKKLVNYPNARELLQAITTSSKETIITKAHVELLRLKVKNRLENEDLEKYTKKYCWIPMYQYCDEPWSIKDFKQQLSHIKNPNQELKNYYANKRHNLSVYKNFRKTIKDKKFKGLVDIVHCFAYLKEMRDDYRRQAYFYLIPLWKELARRLNLSIVEINFLLMPELIRILKAGKNIYKNQIKERNKAYSMVLKNRRLKIYGGKSAFKVSKFVEIGLKVQKIFGQIAYQGKITGRVKIVYHRGEFNKFKKGDMLVTTMTHPEFLPLMKIAKAIITDEGGITCHAAITAREFKKPCIIGTKIATKVLKDGDFVEVDADKGVVRIIRKQSSSS